MWFFPKNFQLFPSSASNGVQSIEELESSHWTTKVHIPLEGPHLSNVTFISYAESPKSDIMCKRETKSYKIFSIQIHSCIYWEHFWPWRWHLETGDFNIFLFWGSGLPEGKIWNNKFITLWMNHKRNFFFQFCHPKTRNIQGHKRKSIILFLLSWILIFYFFLSWIMIFFPFFFP